jgi:hypothetical protein
VLDALVGQRLDHHLGARHFPAHRRLHSLMPLPGKSKRAARALCAPPRSGMA